MAKKKKNERLVVVPMADGVGLVVDIEKFEREFQAAIAKANIDADRETIFSLTQAAEVSQVEAPQLNYYVKMGVVSPTDSTPGKKKYFNWAAVLAMFIIARLKETIRINIDCLEPLQRLCQ